MEIILELAEAYLQDRANELLNDCKSGTPFVFINGLVLLKVLDNIKYFSFEKMHELDERYGSETLESSLENLTNYFSLTDSYSSNKLNLTHKNEDHLSQKSIFQPKPSLTTTLSAENFIKDIKTTITNVFTELQKDKIAAAKAYIVLNQHPFVGYGQE